MYSEAARDRVRDALVELARADSAICGAALVGSAARGAEDRWSDIDLALQLAPDADEPTVVAHWTAAVRADFGLADVLDVRGAGIRYRVLLLPSSLQVDVSFWPFESFRATDHGFQLLFGEPAAPTDAPPPDLAETIGWAWLFALHARAAIPRGRVHQAATMLDGLRDRVVVLMCLRHGLDAWHGRGVDRLPLGQRTALRDARAASLDPAELERSKRALLGLLLAEVRVRDESKAATLRPALEALAGGA